eukprot:79465-Amphidinium_carterae.1
MSKDAILHLVLTNHSSQSSGDSSPSAPCTMKLQASQPHPRTAISEEKKLWNMFKPRTALKHAHSEHEARQTSAAAMPEYSYQDGSSKQAHFDAFGVDSSPELVYPI